MDIEQEFPVLKKKDTEAFMTYLQNETSATPGFFTREPNALRRKLAVSVIAKFSQSDDPDQYIPYLAMNYFDRYYFVAQLKEVKYDCDDAAKVHLIAVCCFTISSKMRTKSFSVEEFLVNNSVKINPRRILTMELRILDLLHWQMIPVTPFCFLDYYYSHFKKYGGYRRRCINEIIVQAQGENGFVHYKPSVIATAAFAAATRIAYHSQIPEVVRSLGADSKCVDELCDLCHRMSIVIEPQIGPAMATSEEDEVEEAQLIPRRRRQDKGKAAMVLGPDLQEEEAQVQQIFEADAAEISIEEIVQEIEIEQQRKAKGKAVAGSEEITTEEEIVPEIETEQQREAKDKAVAGLEEIITEEEMVPETETEQQRKAKAKGKGKAVAGLEEITTEEEIVPEIETEQQREARARAKGKGKAVAGSEEITTEEDDEFLGLVQLETAIKRALGQVKKGKAVVGVVEEEEPRVREGMSASTISEIVPVSELVPKKLMNFQLKWPTNVVLPVKDDVVVEESRNVSSRGLTIVPATGTGNNQPTTNPTGGANIAGGGANPKIGCANCSII